MGVVGCPNVERNFDGRIYLRRVSKQKKVAKASRNRRFAVDVQVNEELTNGDWRRMIVDTNITAREALDLIIDVYDLDAFVAERLIFITQHIPVQETTSNLWISKMNRGWIH